MSHVHYQFIEDFNLTKPKNAELIAFCLVCVNNSISLTKAGELIYNDASRFHKPSCEINRLVEKGYLKKDEDSKVIKYKCDFDKISEDIITKSKQSVKESKSWIKRVFTGDWSKKYEYLKEFWKNDKVKETFLDRDLILTILKNNLNNKFLIQSFCYFMELPVFVMLHSNMMKDIEEWQEEEHTNHEPETNILKSNIIFNLFLIEDYVLKLKDLEKYLFFPFIHEEEGYEIMGNVIEIHAHFYSEGKKVYSYAFKEEEKLPNLFELKFLSAYFDKDDNQD